MLELELSACPASVEEQDTEEETACVVKRKSRRGLTEVDYEAKGREEKQQLGGRRWWKWRVGGAFWEPERQGTDQRIGASMPETQIGGRRKCAGHVGRQGTATGNEKARPSQCLSPDSQGR